MSISCCSFAVISCLLAAARIGVGNMSTGSRWGFLVFTAGKVAIV